MVVIVFRARLREGVDLNRLAAAGTRMAEIATGMPGFVSYKDFAAEDGENVTLVEFASEETLLAWRDHPEHQAVQRQGRDEFFADYRIQVCAPLRDYRFSLDEGRVEPA